MERDELKKRSEQLGLTQTDLAKEIGIFSNTVSRYETGLIVILKSMKLLLEALEAQQIKKLRNPIEV